MLLTGMRWEVGAVIERGGREGSKTGRGNRGKEGYRVGRERGRGRVRGRLCALGARATWLGENDGRDFRGKDIEGNRNRSSGETIGDRRIGW